MENQTVNVNINGADYKVPAGLNILEACKSIGVEIPFFCYHPSLKVAGSCRMCLVQMGMPARDRATGQPILDENGVQKIAFMPKPVIACGTKVSEGMHVITNSEAVADCRRGVLEFLLLNHPLDCPICDKAGECKLQEYTHAYGRESSRYVEEKNIKRKKREFAGKIFVDAERCIQCSRCIRFCKEFIGRSIMGFTKRGSKVEIGFYDNADNESNYLLNIVDGCPVGALTEKAFRFEMRTWFLKTTESLCGESSAGVNTRVWSRNGKIYRITPRQNGFVNDMFMSDSGRYVFKQYEQNRLATAKVDSTPCDAQYAVSRAGEIAKIGAVAFVANGWQSVEEMFLLRQLAAAANAEVYMASHLQPDDGKLVSADATANMRGAFATGLIDAYPRPTLSELASKVESGDVKTVVCFGEDLLKLGFEPKHFKLANIVYCGVLDNETAKLAKICIPLRNEFEKDGMWINRQFRLQKFAKAVDAPEQTVDDVALLSAMLKDVGGETFEIPTVGAVRAVISRDIEFLKGCENVGSQGRLLDGSKFASIDFPEENAMFFAKNQHAKTGE